MKTKIAPTKIRMLSALTLLPASSIIIALGQVITATAATTSDPTTASSTSTTAAPQTTCTLYASPSGSGSTCSSSSPCSLDTANGRAVPGNTVCLMAGVYQRTGGFYPRNGSASGGYVTIDGGVNGEAILRGPIANGHVLHVYNGQYVILQNLTVDSVDSSGVGLDIQNSHHVIVRHVFVHNAGGAGIESTRSDYITIDHSFIFHNGYNPSQAWGSGAAVHLPLAIDSAPGFHYYVTNNIISGEYDASPYRSEGHGVIIDGGNAQRYSAPVLIANNVIFSNAGRCILPFNVTGGHWIVNNTCYKNGLDIEERGCGFMVRGCQDEYRNSHSLDNHFVNNIARSWDIQHPYANTSDSSGAAYNQNLWWGTGNNQMQGGPSVTGMIRADPLFVDPPYVSDVVPTVPGMGWFWDALDPRQLGNRLQLQGGSPAINAGIDPTTLTSDPAIQAGLRQYVYQDINGVPRPQSGAFDLGAYEYSSGAVSTPTPATTRANTPTATRTNTPTPAATSTRTPTPRGVVVGHVAWQAIPQPDARNAGITATLTLCNGSTPLNYTVATDAGGFFTVTTALPDGTYTWAIKGATSLANRGSLTLSGGTANQEMGTMRAGDANNSNVVEASDSTILRATFGMRPGDPGYDSRGDFDRTNVIDVSDYMLLKSNFGHVGAATTCP